MLGTALNWTTAKILYLSSRVKSQAEFDEERLEILKEDLKEALKRSSYELFKQFEKKIDGVQTYEEYLKLTEEISQHLKKMNEQKLKAKKQYYKRMANLKVKDCQKMLDKLTSDYDMATIDRESKMLSTIRSRDKYGRKISLFVGDTNPQTYLDKKGRTRYKVNDELFDYENLNHLARFLQKNDMAVHINALVWHDSVPEQLIDLEKSDLSAEEKKKRCEDFLYGYMKSYVKNAYDNGLDLKSIEIFNEIANDEGTDELLRDSVFKRLMGDNYYIDLLKMAREIFPEGTKFVYNEYSEFDPVKKEKILQIVKNIQEVENREDTRLLDAIGLQCHLYGDEFNFNAGLREYVAAARNCRFPKEVRITELDSANCGDRDWQQQQMKDLYAAARTNGISSLTTWSDLSPFVDHVEDVNGLGTLDEHGNSTPLNESMVNNLSEKSMIAETQQSKTLSSQSNSGGETGAQ